MLFASYRQDFAIENDMNYIIEQHFLLQIIFSHKPSRKWLGNLCYGWEKGETLPCPSQFISYEYKRAPLLSIHIIQIKRHCVDF